VTSARWVFLAAIHGIIDGVVAFYLPGGVPIYAFALMLGAAAALGLAWVAWEAPPKQTFPRLDAGLSTLAGGLVGGRAAYVALHWGYFQNHSIEIPQVYLGGLAWPGALAGTALGLALYAGIAHQGIGKLADALLPLGLVLLVAACLACWMNGCAYGLAIEGWWALPVQDEWGDWERRVPVQLLGALLALVIYWLVERLRPTLPVPGQAAILAGLLFSLVMFALSWLRADPTPILGGLRLEAWSSLAFAALTGLALLVCWLRHTHPK